MSKLILTASSMACALRCPRRYWYDNILGLKEANPSEALRIGTAVHNGGEARAVEELYDCISVLLRTVDVLEGRQALGKPKGGEE